MDLLGVADAASELGVSRRRVRQMLASGAVRGQQVGRTWVIHPSALEPLRQHRATAGRPWQPVSAWALLAVACGRDAALSPSQRFRARRRLDAGLENLLVQLAVRGTVCSYYAHPSIIPLLGAESDVVPSGISAAAYYRLDIVATDQFEGYVPVTALSALARRFAFEEDAERPNVALRVVEDRLWPFEPGDEVAPPAIVAVDLLEAADERSQRAATQLLQQL